MEEQIDYEENYFYYLELKNVSNPNAINAIMTELEAVLEGEEDEGDFIYLKDGNQGEFMYYYIDFYCMHFAIITEKPIDDFLMELSCVNGEVAHISICKLYLKKQKYIEATIFDGGYVEDTLKWTYKNFDLEGAIKNGLIEPPLDEINGFILYSLSNSREFIKKLPEPVYSMDD